MSKTKEELFDHIYEQSTNGRFLCYYYMTNNYEELSLLDQLVKDELLVCVGDLEEGKNLMNAEYSYIRVGQTCPRY